jgi:hypothetical protein
MQEGRDRWATSMSELDEDRYEPRSRAAGGTWSLAALSVAVFLCSVLGAKLLSQMVDRGELDQLALRRQTAPQEAQVYSIVRSVGVDGMTTATIPHRGPAPLSPCGEDEKRRK